jgi:hypothetical protein
MKVPIEIYNGFEIYFDTDQELFGCEAKTDSKNSKSFTAVKTWIREFIKENSTFEPFIAVTAPGRYYKKK